MKQPAQAPIDLDDLPFPQRLAAQVLGAGLDYLNARHQPSWDAGQHAGYADASQTHRMNDSQPTELKLALSYGDQDHQRPGKDLSVFGNERIQISAEARAAMRNDCTKYLPQDEQPTGEQWKVILAMSPTCVMTGGSGTGKSRTLMFRALFLHRYVRVPLNQIQILTFSREARMELAADMHGLFRRFGVELQTDECLTVVKTPRSSLLEQVHSLPDLATVIPFEIYGLPMDDSGSLSDGRPFEAAVGIQQREEMTKCLNQLYRSNKRFSEIYQALWAASLRLPALEVDSPEVVKRAPLGWKLSEFDAELCDTVENLWTLAKAWPIEGITVARKAFTLRGRSYSTHGFIPQLGMHVVLGFDRKEGPKISRGPAARLELYKEVAIKRTLLQAYFPEELIHLDSYQEAVELGEALKAVARSAPSFTYALKGGSVPVPLIDSFNTTATLLESLGLEIASVPGRMNFLPDDPDSIYFEVLSVYWQALERYLLGLPNPVIPFGRLFTAFGKERTSALRHVPIAVLGQCRHMLIDGAEDQPVPVAMWARSVLAEIRRRDLALGDARRGSTSLTVAGDPNQWIYGSFGASPRLLADFDDYFQCNVPATRSVLTESFRSSQPIIEAAFNLVQNLNAGHTRAPLSVAKLSGVEQAVKIIGDAPIELQRLCEAAAGAGHTVLILIDGEDDKSWVDTAVGDRIRQDRASGGKGIRVRSFHKAKALEAEVVVLVGDPSAGTTSWYRNQLFKIAGFGSGGDLTPGDTVLRGEALRLAYVAITRAKIGCYWFPNRNDEDGRTASTIVGLLPGLFDDRR